MAGEELFTRAGAALSSRRIATALELYGKAEQAGYDFDECAGARWTCYMLAGEFEMAWRESDAIASHGLPDPHRFWDGQSFQGRSVLLRCLHGLGDTIQFVRYAPLIRLQARAFTIEAQPKLKALLQQSGLADRVITWGEPEPLWDQQVEVMELPRIFRTTLDSIPKNLPYIAVAMKPPGAPERPCPLIRIGVVWASSRYNPARSVPIEKFARLFDIADVSFCSLQAGEEGGQMRHWATQVTTLPEENMSILGTAQVMKDLDLVITVDTMTAHLAGAMGRPVWTLLPYEGDWRWMMERSDSPWYPTMRLFRQPRRDDWDSVIEEVRAALIKRVQEHRPAAAPLVLAT